MGQLATWERAADEALAASQQRAQQAQARIQELEAQRQDMQDKMQSTQETLKSVSKQLKSSYAAYLARKSEVADLNQAFEVRHDDAQTVVHAQPQQGEREQLLDDIRSLAKEVKLLDAIMNSAIPQQYQVSCRL